jgi:hypothetical protein
MTDFVLVGHCGADSHMLRQAVMRAIPGARMVGANDAKSLAKYRAPHAGWDVRE